MNKKKGFTLIELLAVIVILALIVIIAVPKILDVIEKSERTAWGESAGLMAKAAELKYSEGSITNTERNEIYEFENGDFKSGSPTLTFKGDKPYSGKIVQEKGKTTLALISKNKKWCAIKNTGERIAKVYKIGKEITEENCKIGYTGSSDDNKSEEYTCPDISTYPGKDLTSTEIDSDGYIKADGYIFSILNNEATIVAYIGQTGETVDLVIPKTINNALVTSISANLQGKNFKSITVSPNIKFINQGVLYGATINKLNLDYASGLTSLSLSGLTSTGDIVVACNPNLATITNSTGLNVHKLEIENLSKLTEVSNFMGSNIEQLIIKNNENLKKLSKNDFSGTTIKKMELTNIPITTLDMGLVNSNSFEELTLKGLTNLTTIESNSFKDTKLTSLILDNNSVPNLVTIGESAFANKNENKNLNTVVLSNLSKLTTIGNNAFFNQNISTLSLSGLSKLTTIGSNAFTSNNIKIVSFEGMSNVETIESGAFGSNPLTNLDFKAAKNLTSIGEGAFYSSETFKNIDFSGLTQAISGTLVATTGKVDNFNFSNTGQDMTEFINSNIAAFNYIGAINLKNSKVTKLNLQSNRGIFKINLNGCNNLTTIESSSNNINSLDLSNLSSLKILDLDSEENLESLIVNGSNNLESITCGSCTKLPKLDTSGLTKLTKIYMPSCQAITAIRIAENVPATSNLFIDSDKLTCVQIDGDQTRFNANFQTYFPQVDSTVIKSSCNFD